MPITYCRDDPVSGRWSGINALLTEFQVDYNFFQIDGRVATLESNYTLTVSIGSISQPTPSTLLFTLTDSTTQGPFTLPTSAFRDRGDWAASTAYIVNDTFTAPDGGLGRVTFDHTSAGSFSWAANDGAGHDYYAKMISAPGNALPTGGAPNMMLRKSTSADYAVSWAFPLPNGGTTAQVLTKSSNTDQAVDWETINALHVAFHSSTGSTLTSDNVADALEEVAALAGGGGGGAISDLTDVAYATGDPQNGALLVFNSLDWVPTPTPSIGDVMQWQGGDGWQLVPLAFSNLSGDLSVSQLRSAVTNTNLGSTASGPVSIDPSTDTCFNIALSGDVTLNASSVPFGEFTLLVYQLTTTSRTLTFGTHFKTSGSLSTGTASGKAFVLKFFCDGSSIYELSRTAAL